MQHATAEKKERIFQAIPFTQTPHRFSFLPSFPHYKFSFQSNAFSPSLLFQYKFPLLNSPISAQINFQFHHNFKPSMSMSMFSSFDALCAEKLGFSWSASPAAAVKIDDLKKAKGEAVKTPSKAAKDRRTTRSPRFAVELDGVHCFETLVPY